MSDFARRVGKLLEQHVQQLHKNELQHVVQLLLEEASESREAVLEAAVQAATGSPTEILAAWLSVVHIVLGQPKSQYESELLTASRQLWMKLYAAVLKLGGPVELTRLLHCLRIASGRDHGLAGDLATVCQSQLVEALEVSASALQCSQEVAEARLRFHADLLCMTLDMLLRSAQQSTDFIATALKELSNLAAQMCVASEKAVRAIGVRVLWPAALQLGRALDVASGNTQAAANSLPVSQCLWKMLQSPSSSILAEGYGLLCGLLPQVPSLAATTEVWDALLAGIPHEDPLIVKRSTHALQFLLTHLGVIPPVETGTVIVPPTGADADDSAGATQSAAADTEHRNQYSTKGLTPRARAAMILARQQWETYILLLDALDEFPAHILDEVWPRFDVFFRALPTPVEMPMHTAQEHQAAPAPGVLIHPAWVEALIKLGMCHSNPHVRKMVARHLVGGLEGAAAPAARPSEAEVEQAWKDTLAHVAQQLGNDGSEGGDDNTDGGIGRQGAFQARHEAKQRRREAAGKDEKRLSTKDQMLKDKRCATEEPCRYIDDETAQSFKLEPLDVFPWSLQQLSIDSRPMLLRMRLAYVSGGLLEALTDPALFKGYGRRELRASITQALTVFYNHQPADCRAIFVQRLLKAAAQPSMQVVQPLLDCVLSVFETDVVTPMTNTGDLEGRCLVDQDLRHMTDLLRYAVREVDAHFAGRLAGICLRILVAFGDPMRLHLSAVGELFEAFPPLLLLPTNLLVTASPQAGEWVDAVAQCSMPNAVRDLRVPQWQRPSLAAVAAQWLRGGVSLCVKGGSPSRMEQRLAELVETSCAASTPATDGSDVTAERLGLLAVLTSTPSTSGAVAEVNDSTTEVLQATEAALQALLGPALTVLRQYRQHAYMARLSVDRAKRILYAALGAAVNSSRHRTSLAEILTMDDCIVLKNFMRDTVGAVDMLVQLTNPREGSHPTGVVGSIQVFHDETGLVSVEAQEQWDEGKSYRTYVSAATGFISELCARCVSLYSREAPSGVELTQWRELVGQGLSSLTDGLAKLGDMAHSFLRNSEGRLEALTSCVRLHTTSTLIRVLADLLPVMLESHIRWGIGRSFMHHTWGVLEAITSMRFRRPRDAGDIALPWTPEESAETDAALERMDLPKRPWSQYLSICDRWRWVCLCNVGPVVSRYTDLSVRGSAPIQNLEVEGVRCASLILECAVDALECCTTDYVNDVLAVIVQFMHLSSAGVEQAQAGMGTVDSSVAESNQAVWDSLKDAPPTDRVVEAMWSASKEHRCSTERLESVTDALLHSSTFQTTLPLVVRMMTDIYDTLCESMPSAVQIMTHKLLQQLSIDNFRYLELAAQDTLFPIVCRLLVYREEKAEFVAEPAELTVPCFKQQLTDAVLRYGPDSDADNATVDKSFGPAGATTRLQMLLWLDQLPTDNMHTHFLMKRLTLQFMEDFLAVKDSANFMPGSLEHGLALRRWQTMCLLVRFVRNPADAVMFAELGLKCMNQIQVPSVRQYIEAYVSKIIVMFPLHLLEQLFTPLLRDFDCRQQVMASRLIVAARIQRDLCAIISGIVEVPLATQAVHSTLTATQIRARLGQLGMRLVRSFLPWIASHVGVVRTVAVHALLLGASVFLPELGVKYDTEVLNPDMDVDELLRGLAPNQEAGDDASSALHERQMLLFVLKDLVQCMSTQHDSVTLQHKQSDAFHKLHTENLCSLHTLVCAPVSEHGELMPVAAVDMLKEAFCDGIRLTHTGDLYPHLTQDPVQPPSFLLETHSWADLVPCPKTRRTPAMTVAQEIGYKIFKRDQIASAAAAEGPETSTVVPASPHDIPLPLRLQEAETEQGVLTGANYQRKIIPFDRLQLNDQYTDESYYVQHANQMFHARSYGQADRATTGSGTAVGAVTSSEDELKASNAAGPSYATDDMNLGKLHRRDHTEKAAIAVTPKAIVANARDSHGRPHQPLILMAALVDKLPNLGGLARTAEIFGAEALVLSDMRVVGERVYRSLSVSACDWMPTEEVKVEYMLLYLRQKRREGYTIVGLEQTANSVELGNCELPEKMVLVLGKEKEGMPAQVIQELDVVVEIPQLGIIRSLNVHVSGALLVWEYTRQRLARARAAIAASTAGGV